MRVWIVYLHEDKSGPEWDYIEAVFSTPTLAAQYITDGENRIAKLNRECKGGNPYSYKVEPWIVQ